MIGDTISHYRITKQIGAGGMGVVYKAQDTKLHVDRALKFLRPEALDDPAHNRRFLTEARTLASVQHPNICPIQEIGEEDGQVFIAMSFLEGVTLQERLASGALPMSTAIAITRDIASGLQKAHTQGVIHRDIKPGNVMLTDDGPAVIMDFGLAKQRDATAITRKGAVMGTVAYMSPEQARGDEVDSRSDLWSVGTMLYEMLTGRRPFVRNSDVAQLTAAMRDNPEPISRYRADVPTALEEIVERLLEKDPKRRYADAGELLDALAEVEIPSTELDETIALGKTRRLRLQRWQRRKLARAAATTGFVAALLAVALYLWPGFLLTETAISAIAVMPLQERIEDPEEAYFAEGITDELITSLAKTRALKVISRSSAERAQERYETQEEIARSLGVQALMEGSIQRIDGRLRMTVQLVRPSTGEVLWADSFERPQRSVYALQGEIARALAGAIKIEMTAEVAQALVATQEVDPRVHELLLKARFHKAKFSAEGFARAIEYLESALAIDSGYSSVHAELASICQLYPAGFADDFDMDLSPLEVARDHLDRALELDPDDATAHSVAATMAWFSWDWETSVHEFERAVELDPSLSDAWSEGGWMFSFMQDERALEWSLRAKSLDPLVPIVVANLGVVYVMLGRFDEAFDQFQAALELEPDFGPALGCLGQWYIATEQYEEAIEFYADLVDRGVYESGDIASLGLANARAGHRDEAEAMLQRLLDVDEERRDYGTLAILYNGLGDRDSAVQCFLKEYERRNVMMPFALYDPGGGLVDLVSDPRLAAVVDEIGLRPR